MNYEIDKQKILNIYEKEHWGTRNEYRILKKKYSDLPSEPKIVKIFGSFSQFQNLIQLEKNVKNNSQNIVNKCINKESIIKEVKSFFDKIENLTRDSYRKMRKDHKDLPSCDFIRAKWGSFSNFKEELLDKEITKIEEIHETITYLPSEIVDIVYNLLPKNKLFSRKIYRQLAKDNKYVYIPSEKKVAWIFNSFAEFSKKIKEKDIKLKAQEIKTNDDWKRLIKEKRKNIFGNNRKSYYWEPQSRTERILLISKQFRKEIER